MTVDIFQVESPPIKRVAPGPWRTLDFGRLDPWTMLDIGKSLATE